MITLATALWSQSALRFVLLGAATGSLTALVALGIVLVYRTSGVLNFSAGALGGIAAYLCYNLRDGGWPAPVAVTVGLLGGVALGLLTYGVMALLRNASQLAKLIATLGLFSTFQAFMVLRWGVELRQPRPLLPSKNMTLFGDLIIGRDRLVLIGVALLLALVLRLVYSGTLFGLATSAVAENRRVAASAGWSPDRIEMANFAIAGGLSALAAIFLAPIVTLNAAVLSLAVLPALAAALVGRFSSFGITVLAALGIGIIQSEISLFRPDIAKALGVGAASLTGLVAAVPLAIILIYMIVTGRSRLQRGETLARLPLPGSGRVSLLPLVVGVIMAVALLVGVDTWADALITTFAIGIILYSVIVVAGYAGQLSLCQFALAGMGAWMAAHLMSADGWSFELAMLAAVVGTTLVGVVVALPAIRTRGTFLAIATLAIALMFNALIFTNSAVTGGVRGLPIDHVSFAGVDLDPLGHPQRYGAFVLIFLVIVGLLVANLRRGRVGARLLAVRSNERAAASLGVNVIAAKVYAFAVAAAIAALGGVLLSLRQSNVQFAQYNVFGSVLLIQYAVVGGIAWVSGAALAAAGAPTGLGSVIFEKIVPSGTDIISWLAVLSGVGAITVLRHAPDGVAALYARGLHEAEARITSVRRAFERTRVPRAVTNVPLVARRADRPAAALAMTNLVVKFGGVVAVDGVSFTVNPGEVVGLIGPNGAGKTTILDVITGFTAPAGGSVAFGDTTIDKWSVERRARAGIVRSWQAVELFEEMTVRDNLLVAADDQSRRRYVTDLLRPGRPAPTPLMHDVVETFGLGDVLDLRPSALPHGVARLVGIARALVTEPAVLLLDEPAAGLDTNESAELGRAIREMAQRFGIGVLVIEHDVPLILQTCDRVVALDFGRKIADGTPDEISRNALVIESYLGTNEVTSLQPVGPGGSAL
ncbi:MAG TPA: branched-chain amino acid ABC transporter permease/ATP-binding protein [Acidimicrobiia bacterium]|nr:branched-chain amino acid ABC transporter permease/ATP-binding protein [Acidimicrobiia bacterium]